MRMSKLFSTTLREPPADVASLAPQLLMRAGYLRTFEGQPAYLPLGKAALRHIEAIIDEQLAPLGVQEIDVPGEAAEAVDDLARREIRSHRQLPQTLLVHMSHTTHVHMLTADETGRADQIKALRAAIERAVAACDVVAQTVIAQTGVGSVPSGWAVAQIMRGGPDRLLVCPQPACGYAAEQAAATAQKSQPAPAAPATLAKVATPETTTIAALAELLGVPESATAKAVFYTGLIGGEKCFIFALVRGDMDVSEAKLAAATGATALQPATNADILVVGAAPGYASPIGIRREGAVVVVDDLIPTSPNLVAGANQTGYHLLNTVYGRDYTADLVTDIALAQPGDLCLHCGTPLVPQTATILARVMPIPLRRAIYLDAEGRAQPIRMAQAVIYPERLLSAVVEQHHDADGILWPPGIAPYDVHLASLALKPGDDTDAAAESLYRALTDAGIHVLFDDRDERPGVKFKDADLIGLPIRLTVGARSLREGGVEFKRRNEAAKEIVPLEEVTEYVARQLGIPQNKR
jgi:prolyl-tRNA synthetase